MKTHFTINIRHFYFDSGWFYREPFKLFSITIFETAQDSFGNKIGMFIIFDIQFLKFIFTFGWRT